MVAYEPSLVPRQPAGRCRNDSGTAAAIRSCLRPPEYDLRVDSCRPKPWTQLITIRYNDELFVLNKEMSGHAPRPYVYMLKKLPAGQMVRGLRDYDPAETLQKE